MKEKALSKKDNIAYWNYRVIEQDSLPEAQRYSVMYKVFYDKKGKILSYSSSQVVAGNDKEDLINLLLDMVCDARKYPTLKKSELENNVKFFK